MPDTRKIKAELETKLRQLLERCTEIEDVLSDPGDADWEENALAMENDEALSAIGDVTKREIHDIRRALRLIEEGTYGTCQTCGQTIGAERLSAIPWTTTCVRCA